MRQINMLRFQMQQVVFVNPRSLLSLFLPFQQPEMLCIWNASMRRRKRLKRKSSWTRKILMLCQQTFHSRRSTIGRMSPRALATRPILGIGRSGRIHITSRRPCHLLLPVLAQSTSMLSRLLVAHCLRWQMQEKVPPELLLPTFRQCWARIYLWIRCVMVRG